MTGEERIDLKLWRDEVKEHRAELLDTLREMDKGIQARFAIQDGRLSDLERERIAREAVAAAGTRLDAQRQQTVRWQITATVAVVGTFGSLILGLWSIVHPV